MVEPVTALIAAGLILACSKTARAAVRHGVVSAYRATGWRTPSQALVHHSGRAGAFAGRLAGRSTRSARIGAGVAGRYLYRTAEATADRRWQRRIQAGHTPVPVIWRHRGADAPPAGQESAAPRSAPDRPLSAQAAAPDMASTSLDPSTTEPAPTGATQRRTPPMSRTRLSVNLDAPSTDAEFLESCIELGDLLRSLAEEIENWADSLTSLGLPASVMNPLHAIADGIGEAATGASQAAAAFADEFDDARQVASRGMTITGRDAA